MKGHYSLPLLILCLITLFIMLGCNGGDPVEPTSTPPQFTVSNIASGDTIGANTTLEIEITDGQTIDQITVSLDDGTSFTAALTSDTTYTAELTGLPDGEITLQITVVDNAGVTANTTLTVTVDAVAPTLEISDPADNAVIGSSYTFKGTASDSNSMDKVEIDLGDGFKPATGKDNWSYEASSLVSGSTQVTVRATDSYGNSTTKTITVVVDSDAPVVSITDPSDGAVIGPDYTFVGTASDNNSVSKVEIDLGSGYVTASGTENWTYNATGLSDGALTVTARVTDDIGITTTATINLTVDATNPTVAITNPSDGVTVGPNFTIMGTASDNYNVALVEIDDGNGFVAATGTSNWNYSFTSVPAGSLALTVRATDDYGNTNTDSINLTVDIDIPNVTFTDPIEGQEIGGANYLLTGTASDNSAVTLVEISINGGAYASASDTAAGSWATWEYNASGFTSGANTISARVSDDNGTPKQFISTIQVDYDDVAPVISDIQIAASGNELTITWKTDEETTSELQIDMDPGFGSPTSSPADGTADQTNHSITMGSLEYDALYYVEITCEDEWGNAVTTAGTDSKKTECITGVDFIIEDITTPSTAFAKGIMDISIDIRNRGTSDYNKGTPGNAYMRIYASTDDVYDGGDKYIDSFPIDSVPACQTITMVLCQGLPTALGTGTYYIVGNVDATDIVPEADETNNEGPSSTTFTISSTASPDITASFDSVSPTSVYQSGPGPEIDITVSNLGDAWRSSFSEYVFLDVNGSGNYESGTDVKFSTSDWLSSPFLCSGTSETQKYTGNIPGSVSPGSYNLMAKVDYFNSLPESDETNNVITYSTPITVVAGDANLELTSLTLTGATGSIHDSIPLEISIKNTGTTPSGACKIFLGLSTDLEATWGDTWDDNVDVVENTGAGMDLYEIPVINASETYTLNSFANVGSWWIEPCTGTDYYLYAEVDTYDSVDESDETDNSKWTSSTFAHVSNVDIKPIDLGVADSTFSLSGTTTSTVTYKLTNIGSNGFISDPFGAPYNVEAKVAQSGDPYDTMTDPMIGSFMYPNPFEIDGNETFPEDTINIDVSSLSAGDYDLYLYADSWGTICDDDEGNNFQIVGTITITS